MGLNTAALDFMLNALAAEVDFVSLHTDVIGSGNTNECTGGSPAYARKGITWAASSGGSIAKTGTQVFDVAAATTVRRLGFQNAVTSGTYYGDAELTDEVFAGQGTYTLTAATITLT